MIRRIVDWLLYKLGWEKRKPALQSLLELLPSVMAVAMLISICRHIRGRLPWYCMVWLKIKSWVRVARAVAIGY